MLRLPHLIYTTGIVHIIPRQENIIENQCFIFTISINNPKNDVFFSFHYGNKNMVVMNTANESSLKTAIENRQKTNDHSNHVWSYLFNGLKEVIFVSYFLILKKTEMLTQTNGKLLYIWEGKFCIITSEGIPILNLKYCKLEHNIF